MTQTPTHEDRRVLDLLATDLQALRASSGLPSYGEIAGRVASLRQMRGATEFEARVGRTTVYDVFRTGRTRVDPQLVADVVLVLSGDEDEAESWRSRCVAALAPPEELAPQTVTPQVVAGEGRTPGLGARLLLVMALACVGVNLLGRALTDVLDIPLYLDMSGTALAAFLLGPWWGAGVGLTTNLLGIPASGTVSLWFTGVNVVGALGWGYGVHRWGMARSVPRLMVLSLAVAVLCSAFAVPVVLALTDTNHSSDGFVARLHANGVSVVLAVVVANTVTSVLDKTVSAFVALSVVESLGQRWRAALPASWFSSPRD
jgi:energy-coupling factor transport system substrate-specific component